MPQRETRFGVNAQPEELWFAECLEKRFSGAGEPLPEKKPAGPIHWTRRLRLWLRGLFRRPGP